MGSPSSTYKAVVAATTPRLSVGVQPSTLSFTYLGEAQDFLVTVNASIINGVMSASLVWDDGTYRVRSPVVAHST